MQSVPLAIASGNQKSGRAVVLERKKTKIARIIARLNVGGPARHVVWLTEALQDDKTESVLIAGKVPEGEEDMAYFAGEHGVEATYIEDMSRELSFGDLSALWKIWRELVAFGPDIVHTHTAKAGTLGRTAAFLYRWFTPSTLIGRPRNLRVFHTFHGHIFHGYYSASKTRLFLFIERMLARFATDTIIVISRQQADEIANRFEVARAEKITVVPLGLDLSVFKGDESSGEPFREELGIKNDELLVGMVGRLTEIKNHALFIEAVMASDFPNARFVIIGDGHLRSELEELSRESGIIFSGNRSDLNAIYPALDIVALTSINEGTPLSLIEAMACGKPWVATAVGGVVDLAGPKAGSKSEFRSSKPDAAELEPESLNFELRARGVLVESEDTAGFINGLALLLGDEDLRQTLGVNGKTFVNNNYTKERLVEDIKKLYRL